MVEELQARFGSLVAAHRKLRGLTQQQLADDSEMSIDMIRQIEGGHTGVRFPTIIKLAGALKVDPAQLFSADFPDSALKNPKLSALTVKLAKMSEADLDWLDGILPSLMARR